MPELPWGQFGAVGLLAGVLLWVIYYTFKHIERENERRDKVDERLAQALDNNARVMSDAVGANTSAVAEMKEAVRELTTEVRLRDARRR